MKNILLTGSSTCLLDSVSENPAWFSESVSEDLDQHRTVSWAQPPGLQQAELSLHCCSYQICQTLETLPASCSGQALTMSEI